MKIRSAARPKSAAPKLAVAAVAAVLALSLGVAVAQQKGAGPKTFTDPLNRFSFQHPTSIAPDVDDRPGQPMSILVGVADYECQIFAVNRPESADKDGDVVRRSYSTVIAPDKWKASMDGFQLYGRAGVVQSSAVDTTKYFPVQTAQITTDENKPAIGVLHARPGFEAWLFCTAYDGKDHTSFFNQVTTSFAGVRDAELQAQGEALAAERAARTAQAEAQAAQEAAAAAQQKGKKKK